MTALASPDLGRESPFRIRVTVGDRLVVVFVDGELDVATAPELATQLDKLLDVPRVVVDLRDVDFIDSHGLAVIVTARSSMRRRSHDLEVRAASPAALRLMAMTGYVNEVAVGGENLDVDGWLGLCRQDQATVATRPAGLDDGLLGEFLVAVAQPAMSGSGIGGEVSALARLVRAAGWEPSVALGHLVWVGETVIRVVVPELTAEQRVEAWRGLGEVVPKTMAVVAGVAIGRLQADAASRVNGAKTAGNAAAEACHQG